jgi:hypothetical protein
MLMQNIADNQMALAFLGWQCRLRQISMRQDSGRPGPGMMPQVSLARGEVILPGMVVLLLLTEPEETTTLLEFQAKRSNDPRQIYEAGLKFLQADFYHKPKRFNGNLAAQFPDASNAAQTLVDAGECILRFDQFSQSWTLPSHICVLEPSDPAHRYTRTHNAIFSARPVEQPIVLQFSPQWQRAQANPLPSGA